MEALRANPMEKKNLIQQALEIFWGSFLLNICFLIANSLIFGALLFVEFSLISLPVYLVAFSLFNPALSALIETVGQVRAVGLEEISPKLYAFNYRLNFKGSFSLGLMYLSVLVILGTNIVFMNAMGVGILTPFFLILAILVMLHLFLMNIVTSKLVVSKPNGAKLALHLMLNHPKQMILLCLTFVLTAILFLTIPHLAILFAFPILAFFGVVFTEKPLTKIIENLEAQYQRNYPN